MTDFDRRVAQLYERLISRWHSPHPIRRYAHRAKFAKILAHVPPGGTVVDVGRGGSVDGVLGVLAAARGARVTITNPRVENLQAIRRFAASYGVAREVEFVAADPSNTGLPSGQCDLAVSLHVLEHVNDFSTALAELARLTRSRAVVALPTCLNPCVASRLGGVPFYEPSLLGPLALLWGCARITFHAVRGDAGVEESMEDDGQQISHLWRFPAVMRRELEAGEFRVERFVPDSLCLPWFSGLVGLSRKLDEVSHWPVLRDLGLGSHAHLKKRSVPQPAFSPSPAARLNRVRRSRPSAATGALRSLHAAVLAELETLHRDAEPLRDIVEFGPSDGALLRAVSHWLPQSSLVSVHCADGVPTEASSPISSAPGNSITPGAQPLFDIALAVECFDHVSSFDDLLASVRRCLRPNGRLVLSIPSFISPSSQYPLRSQRGLLRLQPPLRARRKRLQELTEWLVAKGFAVERSLSVNQRTTGSPHASPATSEPRPRRNSALVIVARPGLAPDA